MEVSNTTLHSEFILLGFNEWPHLHFILFLILLLFYLMALTGNLIIIVLVTYSSNLHTPMYLFLFNLAILDILLISTIMPKILNICLTANQSITYIGCIAQILFFSLFAVAENFLLTVMAYDRCLAICFPLHYFNFMNLRISFQLALSSWGLGVMESLLMSGLLSNCSFTNSHTINHLFCNMESLLELSTGCTQVTHMAFVVFGLIFGLFPMVFILATYAFIIYSILKIHSNEGKRKAFSTCSSHIIVITLFLGIMLKMYIQPKAAYSVQGEKIQSVLYTALIPTLNPIIYTLKNKEINVAFKKFMLSMHGPYVR